MKTGTLAERLRVKAESDILDWTKWEGGKHRRRKQYVYVMGCKVWLNQAITDTAYVS
jgi:hypothetical protein